MEKSIVDRAELQPEEARDGFAASSTASVSSSFTSAPSASSASTGKLKHRRIFECLRDEILAGVYLRGDRVPSETRLVERFEVSRPTAARALRELESLGLVERRHGSGTFVVHQPPTKKNTLGLLVTGLGHGEFFEPICHQLAKSLADQKLALNWGQTLVGDANRRIVLAEEVCRQFIEQEVAGVFFQPLEMVPGLEDVNDRIIEAFKQANMPVVLIDSDYKRFPHRSDFDLVGIDNRRVGFALADHLLKLGCRRIDFIGHRGVSLNVDARVAGYREALCQYGIFPQQDWVHVVEGIDTINVEIVRQIVSANPADAYICHNDYTAGQLMRDLIQLGLSVPEDVRVVGVDDIKYASSLSVPLTTARQPCAQIGAMAVELMLQRIANPALPPRELRLDFELVVRESCGAKLPKASAS